MWIIKIGGSWIKNANLIKLIKLLVNLDNQKFIIVPGGGIFADSVREASKLNFLSEDQSHFLALKSTEIFGHMIKSFENRIHTTEKINSFKEKNLWLPSKILKNERNFKKNWESTSDSVATWLYSNISSKGLIFIKSISLGIKNVYKIEALQKKNILDSNMHLFLKKKKNLKIIGPEIIQLLESYEDWDNLLSKLNFLKI
ncbi:MAG: hypothetical protein CL572_02335 [Alphaproteobacteria bacterium]|nr:hypothetical protein [Alphaproteobacteria bacterium]